MAPAQARMSPPRVQGGRAPRCVMPAYRGSQGISARRRRCQRPMPTVLAESREPRAESREPRAEFIPPAGACRAPAERSSYHPPGCTMSVSRTTGPVRPPEPSRRPRGASSRQDRPAPPPPDAGASPSPDRASPAASAPRQSSLLRRLRPRENAATLLRGARGSCLRQLVRSRCRAGARRFAAGCLLLLAILTFPVPASAQTEHWSATLTVGQSAGSSKGYCTSASGRCSNLSEYGTLSDNDFILDGTTYRVESIRWGNNSGSGGRHVHLTLNKDLPAGSLANLTLKLGLDSFPLSWTAQPTG